MSVSKSFSEFGYFPLTVRDRERKRERSVEGRLPHIDCVKQQELDGVKEEDGGLGRLEMGCTGAQLG